MYDIKDILQKAIYISEQKKKLYFSILEKNQDIRLTILINTMIRGVDRDIANYQAMIESVGDIAESIDFDLYDIISSRINQFLRTIIKPEIHSAKELIDFSIGLEQSVYALLVDVQGRLVRKDQKVESSVTYYVLAEMILEKSKAIEKLKKYQR